MNLKKIAALALSLVVSASLSVAVMANDGINQYEAQLINTLKQPVVTQSGAELTLPAEYVNQATTYFAREDVDISAEEYFELNAISNEIVALVAATDATSLRDIPTNVLETATGLAEKAAAIVGVELVINDLTNLDIKVVVPPAPGTEGNEGTVVVTTEPIVKQTGIGFTAIYAAMALLLGTLAVCGIRVRKSRITA